jgi:hypothetical protein
VEDLAVGAVANSAIAKPSSTSTERRERRPVSLRGFAVLDDGSTHEILVLDLSYEGCGIAIPAELKPGQTITFSVLRRGAVTAEVRWWSAGKAGLVFEPEEQPAKPRPRQSERVSIDGEVTLRRLGRRNYQARIFDLSPDGCKAEMVERPSVGEHMLIRFGGLETLRAEVCWVEGPCAGLSFERAFHPAVFDMLLERLRISH